MNWGVPDWKSSLNYSKHEYQSGWRWEFLRRLQEYRQAWEARPENWKEVSYVEHREKWGIGHLENPASPTISSLGFWLKGPEIQEYILPYNRTDSRMRFFDWADYGPHDVLLRFDLTKQIPGQTKLATNFLKKLQAQLTKTPGSRKHAPDALIRFLQVIDAKDAGARNSEIGEILCRPNTGEKAASEAKRLARTARRVQLRYSLNWHLRER